MVNWPLRSDKLVGFSRLRGAWDDLVIFSKLQNRGSDSRTRKNKKRTNDSNGKIELVSSEFRGSWSLSFPFRLPEACQNQLGRGRWPFYGEGIEFI
jgi:hypothetical protein